MACRREEGRTAAILSAVWGQTLSSFIYAFRLPPLRKPVETTPPEVIALRVRLPADRDNFRNWMRDVIKRMQELVHADQRMRQIGGLSFAAIDEFFGNQQLLLEHAPLDQQLDADDPSVEGAADAMDLDKVEKKDPH